METSITQEKNKKTTVKELLKLPLEEQEQILKEQAKKMSEFYEVINDDQSLLDY